MKEVNYRPRRDLTVILVVAFVAVLVIELCLREMRPIFNWKGAAKIADIIVNLALAYVASYVFHVIGDLWNKREENESVQLAIEENLLGLFTAFRELAQRMLEQMKMTSVQHFQFDDNDDTWLSYEWDKYLSEGDEVDHIVAQRNYHKVYLQYMQHRLELDNVKERLPGGMIVRLRELDASVQKVKDALGSPSFHRHGMHPQSAHLNYLGDKINEWHAQLYFFKEYMNKEWKCKHSLLRQLLTPTQS